MYRYKIKSKRVWMPNIENRCKKLAMMICIIKMIVRKGKNGLDEHFNYM